MSTMSELTARYNELTGKSIKSGSYSKTKLEAMIAAATPAKKKRTGRKADGINAAEIARELGVNAKVARAKLRRAGDYRTFTIDRLREILTPSPVQAAA